MDYVDESAAVGCAGCWAPSVVASVSSFIASAVPPRLVASAAAMASGVPVDTAVFGLVFTLLVVRFSDTPKTSRPLTRILGSAFLFVLLACGLFYIFSNMVMFQNHHFHTSLNHNTPSPDTPPPTFIATLPLDLAFGYTRENITSLLESLGPVGTNLYESYILLDSIMILVYTYLHIHILSVLYPDNNESTHLLSKVPWALGAIDMYENIGHFILLGSLETAAGGVSVSVSDGYLARLVAANQYKFMLFFVVLGLEVSGIVQYCVGAVSKEIKASGVTLTASEEQKREEDKKRTRLEKRKLKMSKKEE